MDLGITQRWHSSFPCELGDCSKHRSRKGRVGWKGGKKSWSYRQGMKSWSYRQG